MTPARATLAGLAGLVALVALALSVGAQGFGWGDGGAWALLRAPRVLAALAAGLALGIGGAAQQGVFRNPLADPGLTGVFGGALFGIALLLGIAPEAAWQRAWFLPAAAFAGALGTSALLVLCGRGGSSARLLLTGLGLNAFTAAGTLVIASRSGESRELLTNGAFGDWLGMATFELTWLPILLCFAATLLLLPSARALDLLAASAPERVRPIRGEGQALQISNPPITVWLGSDVLVVDEVVHEVELSARIFDFGVVSLRVRVRPPSACDWEQFTRFGQRLEHHPGITALVQTQLEQLCERMRPAIERPAVAGAMVMPAVRYDAAAAP